MKSVVKIVFVDVGRNVGWDKFFQYLRIKTNIIDISMAVETIATRTLLFDYFCDNW